MDHLFISSKFILIPFQRRVLQLNIKGLVIKSPFNTVTPTKDLEDLDHNVSVFSFPCQRLPVISV